MISSLREVVKTPEEMEILARIAQSTEGLSVEALLMDVARDVQNDQAAPTRWQNLGRHLFSSMRWTAFQVMSEWAESVPRNIWGSVFRYHAKPEQAVRKTTLSLVKAGALTLNGQVLRWSSSLTALAEE